jgi:hypothetical protein
MDSVLCIRWIATGPNAKAQDALTLASRWRRCTPPNISQQEMARLMGLSERADPPPLREIYQSFSVAIR